MLGQQAVACTNSLMSPDPLSHPSAQALLAHHFLSPEMMTEAEADMWRCLPGYCYKRDILPLLPKGSATTGALPSAASVQAGTGGQPLPSASSLHPAANMQQESMVGPARFSGLLAQPTAFAYTESQMEEQQWMDLFLEACLGTESQEAQLHNDAALNGAPTDNPSSSGQQPAEAPLGPLDVPADADSLQRWIPHDCADREVALGPDAWLTAFAQAHLHTSLSSMQHADLDSEEQSVASSAEGSVADHADSDFEEQSVSLSDDEASVFGDDSEADSDSYDQTDADCDDEEYSDFDLETPTLAVESQLHMTLGSRFHMSASNAIGWGVLCSWLSIWFFLGPEARPEALMSQTMCIDFGPTVCLLSIITN